MFVDESPDTSDPALLNLCPGRICVDIPHEEKIRQNLYIRRTETTLCPYIDGRREAYWKSMIDQQVHTRQRRRILMLCGLNHLYAFPAKPKSFPELLRAAGYSVECVDLRKEPWWDESWIMDYRDPDPPANVIINPQICCLALGFDHCLLADDDGPTNPSRGSQAPAP
jgi:hypothetical protein